MAELIAAVCKILQTAFLFGIYYLSIKMLRIKNDICIDLYGQKHIIVIVSVFRETVSKS